MLQRVGDWIKADWWRVGAIVLAIALIGALVVAFAGGGGSSDTPTGSEDGTPTTQGSADSPNASSSDPDAPTTTTEPLDPPDEPGAAGIGDNGFLALKVDNAPGARPQVGIGPAPLLVEVPVEGGITRFSAYFTREGGGVVGPIRSLRPVDADLLSTLSVHVVSTGGQPFVTAAVEATGIQQISPLVYDQFISGGREIPHDTFIDLDVLLPLISGSDENAVGLPIGELPSTDESASSIALPFEATEYRYEDEKYVRYNDGQAFEVLDALDGASSVLSHDIVVVMKVAQRPAGYTDSNDVPVPTYDIVGSGELLVLYQGEVIRGTWTRSAQADPFVFLDTGGSRFGLPEGRVYLGLVPRDLEVALGQ